MLYLYDDTFMEPITMYNDNMPKEIAYFQNKNMNSYYM